MSDNTNENHGIDNLVSILQDEGYAVAGGVTMRKTIDEPKTRSGAECSEFEFLELFNKLLDLRLCIGTRYKCHDGHEWVSAHGDAVWFQMPTCPVCNKPATAQRGEWQTLSEWAQN